MSRDEMGKLVFLHSLLDLTDELIKIWTERKYHFIDPQKKSLPHAFSDSRLGFAFKWCDNNFDKWIVYKKSFYKITKDKCLRDEY